MLKRINIKKLRRATFALSVEKRKRRKPRLNARLCIRHAYWYSRNSDL